MEWQNNEIPATVLIADDEFDMRFLLEKALTKHGFKTIVCEDGGEALEAFTQHKVDIVLLDVQMPGKNGFEVCNLLRQMSRERFIPIVMVTGLEDIQSIETAYEFGADDFITKPINWQILGHRIFYLLKGSRALNQVQEKEMRERALFRALPDSIIRVSVDAEVLDAHFTAVNHPLHFIFPGKSSRLASLLEGRGGEELEHQLSIFKKLGFVNNYDIEIKPAGEESKQIFESRVALSGESEYIFVIRDITKQRAAEERIRYLAFYDNLTGLPNRTFLEKELTRIINSGKRRGCFASLLFINVDKFSRINEGFGLEVGDSLLQAIANRLKDSLRNYDIAARSKPAVTSNITRFGGDEFAVVIENIYTHDVALRIARRVQESMSAPFHIHNIEMHIKMSIGVAFAPEDGETANHLIENADAAMRLSKKNGPGHVEFFSQDISETTKKRVALEAELRYAIGNQEFELYLQPKIALNGKPHLSAEALLRWNNRKLGKVPPDQFIPLAEDTGLILPISQWVVDEAARIVRMVSQQLGAQTSIAVNLSPQQFNNENFLIECLGNALAREKIDVSLLELEITEYVLLDDTSRTQRILECLKDMGFIIAIDDFGTGYSSLNYLSKFEVDALKIDRSFINSLDSERSQKLAKLIISIGHNLGMEVVAEGIETKDQLQFLTEEKCDYAQGYYFSRPLPLAEYIQYQRKKIASGK